MEPTSPPAFSNSNVSAVSRPTLQNQEKCIIYLRRKCLHVMWRVKMWHVVKKKGLNMLVSRKFLPLLLLLLLGDQLIEAAASLA